MFKKSLLLASAAISIASLSIANEWQTIKPASLEPVKQQTATNWQTVKPAALEPAKSEAATTMAAWHSQQSAPESQKPRCKSLNSCRNNPDCQCYCSVKCGLRNKKPTDKPIWVANDNLGHHCYCADRDWRLRNQCAIEKNTEPMDVEEAAAQNVLGKRKRN